MINIKNKNRFYNPLFFRLFSYYGNPRATTDSIYSYDTPAGTNNSPSSIDSPPISLYIQKITRIKMVGS